MATLEQLQVGHKDARLHLTDSLNRYSSNRGSILASMVRGGRKEQDAERLLDAFESLWVPSFSTGSSRAMPNSDARREYDAALRSAVGPELFDKFTGSLLEYRRAQQTTADINEQIYSIGGHDAYQRAETEAADLDRLRLDVVNAVRQMNPTADVSVFLKGGEEPGEAVAFDPVRRSVEIALDGGNYDPDDAVNTAVFEGLTHVLSAKERAILDEAFSTFDQISTDNGKTFRKLEAGETIELIDGDPNSGLVRLKDAQGNNLGLVKHKRELLETDQTAKRAAAAFAKYRKGSLKPDSLAKQALAPFNRFFERVNNLARGRGFQSVNDIYKKVADGKLGARAEKRAKTIGLRMPLPKDNKALYDQTSASIGKMSEFELARTIRTQREQLKAARKDMRSLRKQLFSHSTIARSVSSAANYLKKGGEDALQADIREINELQRGLAALCAEQRRRGSETLSKGLGVPPEPPGQRYSDLIASSIARDVNAMNDVRIDGRFAQYQVEATGTNSQFPMNVGMRTEGSDSDAIKIGVAATAGGAAALINAVEQIGSGNVSMEANKLAVEATRAGTDGNKDISTILQSGLIDPDLNDAISRKDVMAFVYPLKTGDVIFQTDDGRWLAARSEKFLEFVRKVNDPHLSAAADVIKDNVVPMQASEPRTRDLGSPVAPAPKAGLDVVMPATTSPDGNFSPDTPARAAASIGAKVHKVGEGRDEVHALKETLGKYSDEQLKASLQLTREANQAIQPDAPRVKLQEKRSFGRAENALLEVMKSRGMDISPFQASNKVTQSRKGPTASR